MRLADAWAGALSVSRSTARELLGRATPPRRGRARLVLADRDRAGRDLMVSSRPGASGVVLSVWQGPTCLTTLRVAEADVPVLVAALTGDRET